MDFKGDIYDVKYDGKNMNIERETEKDDTLKDYKIEKAYMQGGFSLIEGNETAERIKNFNQNMKHIRIYDKDEISRSTGFFRIKPYFSMTNFSGDMGWTPSFNIAIEYSFTSLKLK